MSASPPSAINSQTNSMANQGVGPSTKPDHASRLRDQNSRDLNAGKSRDAVNRSVAFDSSERPGFNTSDIVAFRVNGTFLAATLMIIDEDDTGVQESKENKEVRHSCVLLPSPTSLLTDAATHLEVVRQGPWVGFRSLSSVGKDCFLQARRRGVHRMAFFSTHFGTWEQWEFEPQQFGAPWKAVIATFRNRRMPSCDFRVEVVRVGTATTAHSYTAHPHPDRSILSGLSGTLDPSTTNLTLKEQNLTVKRMSGLLLNEWLTFVEKESRHRAALEARVEQAMEDVAGLREWASSQVAGIRKDVEDEVSLLLGALSHRTAEWKDASSRLSTRLQWGATLIQAKRAAVLGRRVIHSWMAVTLRARSLSSIESKIRGRIVARTERNTFQAWAAWTQDQINRRARVRAAVRRMALLKMRQVFINWKQHTNDVLAINTAVIHATSQSLLRKALDGWRYRSRKVALATVSFAAQGSRLNVRRLENCFSEWRNRVKEVKLATESFTTSVARNANRASIRNAFSLWQTVVEEAWGEAVQLSRARNILQRRRTAWAVNTWRVAIAQKAASRAAERQADVYCNACLLNGMVTRWRQATMEARDTRALLVAFVTRRAARRQSLCWEWWLDRVRWKAATTAIVQKTTAHRHRETRQAVIDHWRAVTIESKAVRHKEGVLARRNRTLLLRVAVRGWHHVASQDLHHHQLMTAVQSHRYMSRLSMVLHAWHSTAIEATRERRLMQVGDGWYAGRLKARALWGLMDGVDRRVAAERKLETVRIEAFDRVLVKDGWDAWRDRMALRQAVQSFEAKRYLRYYVAHTAWRAWAMVVQVAEEDRVFQDSMEKRVRQRVLGRCFSGWRRHVEQDALALRGEALARTIVARRVKALLSETLSVWRRVTDDGIGTRIKLNAAGVTIAVSRHERLCRKVFTALRSRVQHVRSIVERTLLTKKATEIATLRCIVSCWKHRTVVCHSMWETKMRKFVERRVNVCRQRAFTTWLVATRVSVRNSLVTLHKVERRALTLSRTAWEAWKHETAARRTRRAALVKFMHRSRLSTLGTYWNAWNATCCENKQHREDLERCIIRKRLAFKQFKSWYWETVDEEVHATLQAMFVTCSDTVIGDGSQGSMEFDEMGNVPSLLAPTIQQDLLNLDLQPSRWSTGESADNWSHSHSQEYFEEHHRNQESDVEMDFQKEDFSAARELHRTQVAMTDNSLRALRGALNSARPLGTGGESEAKLKRRVLEDKENADATYRPIYA